MNLNKTLKQIRAAALAENIDGDALCNQFASAHEDWTLHGEAINQHGVVIEDCKGALKANPSCSHKSNAWSRMQRVLEQCGLTPKAKKANAKAAIEDADPLDSIPDL